MLELKRKLNVANIRESNKLKWEKLGGKWLCLHLKHKFLLSNGYNCFQLANVTVCK